jgi:protein gp37
MPDDTYRELDANGYDPGLYNIGKKAAGRLLDGRTWDGLPQVAQ